MSENNLDEPRSQLASNIYFLRYVHNGFKTLLTEFIFISAPVSSICDATLIHFTANRHFTLLHTIMHNITKLLNALLDKHLLSLHIITSMTVSSRAKEHLILAPVLFVKQSKIFILCLTALCNI
jgi:hypothetical protein